MSTFGRFIVHVTTAGPWGQNFHVQRRDQLERMEPFRSEPDLLPGDDASDLSQLYRLARRPVHLSRAVSSQVR